MPTDPIISITGGNAFAELASSGWLAAGIAVGVFVAAGWSILNSIRATTARR